jgi:hypothetical protein
MDILNQARTVTLDFHAMKPTLKKAIAVGMPIAEHAGTDPGGRDSRTRLPPRVIKTTKPPEQLRVTQSSL